MKQDIQNKDWELFVICACVIILLKFLLSAAMSIIS